MLISTVTRCLAIQVQSNCTVFLYFDIITTTTTATAAAAAAAAAAVVTLRLLFHGYAHVSTILS